MARQAGPLKIRGCYDGICFYEMNGQHYARMKSSLTGKRVKRDPAFARTMANAGVLAEASKIASIIYKGWSPDKKIKGAFKRLTSKVIGLMRSGKSKEEVMQLFSVAVREKSSVIRQKKNNEKPIFPFAEALLKEIFGFSEKEIVLAVADDAPT